MKSDVVPVEVAGVFPTNRGCAVFVGNEEKVFTIYVEITVGQAILMFMQNTPKERPLTHDMIGLIFKGLGVEVERVVINDLKNGTYFARLILRQENELGRKIVEIDARPSDCLALAVHTKAPIFVARSVFDEVEDMGDVLKKLNAMKKEEAAGGEPDFDMEDEEGEEEAEEDDPEDSDKG